jgi:hypothetical protein
MGVVRQTHQTDPSNFFLMAINEVLEKEKNNYSCCSFSKEGLFWRAYEIRL